MLPESLVECAVKCQEERVILANDDDPDSPMSMPRVRGSEQAVSVHIKKLAPH